MGKRFLASVADVDLFEKDANGKLIHFASAKTLTDSSIGFSISMEDVRAGRGAKLYGRFGHTTGMTLQMTDVMFDLNYVRVLLGSNKSYSATTLATIEKTTASTDTQITINGAGNMGTISGLDKAIAWYRVSGETEDHQFTNVTLSNGVLTCTLPDGAKGKTLCVTYFKTDLNAALMKVSATFFPAELVAIMTAQEFAGEANAVQTGKPVGTLTVKIPRFQLDGQFDLAMNMTSNATVSLNGSALAVDDNACEGGSYYAELVEQVTGVTQEIVDINIDSDYLGTSAQPKVWAKYADGTVAILNNADLQARPITYLDTTTGTYVDGTFNCFITAQNAKYGCKSLNASTGAWGFSDTWYVAIPKTGNLNAEQYAALKEFIDVDAASAPSTTGASSPFAVVEHATVS